MTCGMRCTRCSDKQVPGVVFLSGGQSEEHATMNLNMMNAMPAKKPWRLTFSFGRALQQTCLNVWQGDDKNVEAAQQAFLQRCRVNGEAQVFQPPVPSRVLCAHILDCVVMAST